MLEFPTWVLAKPWSYISGYAFVDALREIGHEVELALLINLADEVSLNRVLEEYSRQGAIFDCAFFWMPHLNYNEEFWRTAKRISTRRIAVFIESLRYTQDEIRNYTDLAEHYTERSALRTRLLGWLGHCTHVVTMDYHDFLELRGMGYSAFWTPGIVPKIPDKLCTTNKEKKGVLTAATIYGKRRSLHRLLADKGIVDVNERLTHSSELVAEFEATMADVAGLPINITIKTNLAERVRLLRLELWYEYLRYVSKFAGMLSLPAYFKGFPGRVFEGLLAESVVFIFEAHNLDRHKEVFVPGQHIFYLSLDPSDSDISQIVKVAQDPEYRSIHAAIAHDRALTLCGAHLVVGEIMKWVEGDLMRMHHTFAGLALRRGLNKLRLNSRAQIRTSYESS